MKKIVAVAILAAVAWMPAAASSALPELLMIPNIDLELPNPAVALIRDDAGNVWMVIFDDKNMDGKYDPRDGDTTLQVRQIEWGN